MMTKVKNRLDKMSAKEMDRLDRINIAMQLKSTGYSIPEIAKLLHLSESTIRCFLKST